MGVANREIEPYDIVEVNHGEKWEDYATLRDENDFTHAKRLVGDNPNKFRIVSGRMRDRGSLIYGVASK